MPPKDDDLYDDHLLWHMPDFSWGTSDLKHRNVSNGNNDFNSNSQSNIIGMSSVNTHM
jgi:hypothetical protein